MAFKLTKGGFFSESEIRFSNLPISQKDHSKKLSWAWNLNKLFTDMGRDFKFQTQDSFLELFFYGDWEIWQTNLTFQKKPPWDQTVDHYLALDTTVN
jgi:hypothetical protein